MNQQRRNNLYFLITMLINQEPHFKHLLTNYYVIRKDYSIMREPQAKQVLLFNQRSNDKLL